jgi:hypothetical protein
MAIKSSMIKVPVLEAADLRMDKAMVSGQNAKKKMVISGK